MPTESWGPQDEFNLMVTIGEISESQVQTFAETLTPEQKKSLTPLKESIKCA
jgi:hypothetical protein